MQQFSSDQCRNREEQSILRRPLCSRTLFSEVLPTVGPNLSIFFRGGSLWENLCNISQDLLGLFGSDSSLIATLSIFTYHIHSHAWAWLGYVGIHVALLYMSPMIVQGTIGRATSLPDSSDIRLTQWQGNIAMRWTSNGWMRMGGVHKITEE